MQLFNGAMHGCFTGHARLDPNRPALNRRGAGTRCREVGKALLC
jgi:hypothetical protein